MKRILINISLTALILNTSCQSNNHKEIEIESKFLTTSPIVTDTTVNKEYVAQIQSARHIEIRSQERGYLDHIYVDEGQKVKKGELLFQIMPNLYNAEFNKVKAEAKIAEIEYKNTLVLADSNIVSQNELAMALANYDKARAELSLAQVHLGFTEIRAPFDGITNRFEVKLGSLIEEGDLLTKLADNSEMWVYFNVPEAEYLDLETEISDEHSIQVDLKMANNKLFENKGRLATIEADFNNETGNIAFRATFHNPKGLLRHGETGNVLMKVPYPDAILIPQKATFEILDKKYVFVINDDNIVKSKEITIAAELEDLFIVRTGLSKYDKILLEGIRKVKDGDVITTDYQDPEEVMTHLKLYTE
jgi:membrane fusion protein (multidrug efflux system)